MTEKEAIILLIKCQTLIQKLKTHGITIELSKEDQVALNGFSRVWAFGWLNAYSVAELAYLSLNDIELLTTKMIQEVTKRNK